MGLLLLLIKKIVLLCLLFLASMDSTSMAGRRSCKTMTTEFAPETVSVETRHEGDETRVHERRILEVNADDYGKYDPAPALVRPPFKLIPN